MKGSPIFPGFETENNANNNYEFDPQTDFAQFLEEARRYANDKEVPGETHEEKQVKQEKRSKKKSWKTALFSFWKLTEKKNKQHFPKEGSKVSHSSANQKIRRGHFSGPVYGNGGAGAAANGGHRLPMSGPLTSLFNPKKRQENEVAYVSLDKVNKPPYDAKVYGPLYSVS